MNHVPYERVTAMCIHTTATGMSHVYRWVIFRMRESCLIWMSHVSWVISHIRRTYLIDMDESCLIWMSHVLREGVMSQRPSERQNRACIAVCCAVLHCVALSCSVLQCVAVCCSVLQCVCTVLQCVCNKSYCVAASMHDYTLFPSAVCCNVLKCVAVRCSMLQQLCMTALSFLQQLGEPRRGLQGGEDL